MGTLWDDYHIEQVFWGRDGEIIGTFPPIHDPARRKSFCEAVIEEKLKSATQNYEFSLSQIEAWRRFSVLEIADD